MPELSIKSKASALKAAKMLNTVYGPIREREELEGAVYDCLTDLYHLCAHWNLNFECYRQSALANFLNETIEKPLREMHQ